MMLPSPNQARRKALSFLLLSLAVASSSSEEANEGFSTGDLLIIEALSFLVPFILPVTESTFCLVEDEEDEPNPSPDELVFSGGTAVSLTLTAGLELDGSEVFWALIVKWVFVV